MPNAVERLKGETAAQLNEARLVVLGRNLAELRRVLLVVRRGELGPVGYVEDLRAEIQFGRVTPPPVPSPA